MKKLVALFLIGLATAGVFVDASALTEINDPNIPEIAKNFKTKAMSPKEHLQEHLADVKACKQAFKLIKKDQQFLNNWDYSSTQNYRNSTELLTTSFYAKQAPLQHLINNPSRFTIGREGYVGGYFTAARIDEFFCSPEFLIRLYLIEKMEGSSDSWVLRKEFLAEIANLHFPYMDGYGYSFEYLKLEIEKTKKIYSGSLRIALNHWLVQTATWIRSNTENIKDEIDGVSPSKQRLIMLAWANQLEALAK